MLGLTQTSGASASLLLNVEGVLTAVIDWCLFKENADRPLVMGIVNATPDSFADGGRHARSEDALRHCDALVGEGADLLDIDERGLGAE